MCAIFRQSTPTLGAVMPRRTTFDNEIDSLKRAQQAAPPQKPFLQLSMCVMILLFAACIPASPPTDLGATPGASAIITRDSYSNDLFSVAYPTGWRVITSPAGAPPSA